jgi:hypothetical protein
MNIFDKILGEEESIVEEIKSEVIEQKDNLSFDKIKIFLRGCWLPILIFFIALAPRLIFLYTHDPQNAGMDWYGDVYHHWQIAYLSGKIGFGISFLRLWDLKGMEFFWGLGHPLILNILFWLTGSVSILVPRLLSVVGGAVVVSLIFVLLRRHFSLTTAILVSLWASFFSVALFSDTLGMQEQLGLVALLGGIVAWPVAPLVTGLSWAFASTVRSEYWLFALGLLAATLVKSEDKGSGKKAVLALGYFLPIILYMKYLSNYTGNAIFPIYWNFLASVVGKWFTNVNSPFTHEQIIARFIGKGIFVFGFIGTVVTFLKKPKANLLFLVGFLNITFVGFIFGFAAYTHGFYDRFWVDRLFAFPYVFTGMIILIAICEWMPRLLKTGKKIFVVIGVLVLLIILGAGQLAWGKINKYWAIAQAPYKNELSVGEFLGKNIGSKGKVLFPADRPVLTYVLVNGYKFDGARMVSQMYDPYFYANGEGKEVTEKKFMTWIEKENIKYIVYTSRVEYRELFEKYPGEFKKLGDSLGTVLYEVFQ